MEVISMKKLHKATALLLLAALAFTPALAADDSAASGGNTAPRSCKHIAAFPSADA